LQRGATIHLGIIELRWHEPASAGVMSNCRRHTCRRELEAQKCAKRFLNLSWKALSSNEKRSD
jgi:hypothetical protein